MKIKLYVIYILNLGPLYHPSILGYLGIVLRIVLGFVFCWVIYQSHEFSFFSLSILKFNI